MKVSKILCSLLIFAGLACGSNAHEAAQRSDLPPEVRGTDDSGETHEIHTLSVPGLRLFTYVRNGPHEMDVNYVDFIGLDLSTRRVLRGEPLLDRAIQLTNDPDVLAEVAARAFGHGEVMTPSADTYARWLPRELSPRLPFSPPHVTHGTLVFWVMSGSMSPTLEQWRISLANSALESRSVRQVAEAAASDTSGTAQ